LLEFKKNKEKIDPTQPNKNFGLLMTWLPQGKT
jgi:hypothetical protein